MTPSNKPLISLGLTEPVRRLVGDVDDEDDGYDLPRKRWYHYIPLYWAVFLMLLPHPSLLLLLVSYTWRIQHSPVRFLIHLVATYTLTFMAFSSLIVILARDPGPVTPPAREEAATEEMSFTEALLAGDEDEEMEREKSAGRWCRKCCAPRPERAHHCSACGRCVLKFDHHCAWLGYKCIGHRTHTAFVHFLLCITLLSIYIVFLASSTVYYAFTNPYAIDETTPLHALFLTFFGAVIALVIGSFLIYHTYLILTNQTTFEHLSPFLLLRYLPPLPSSDGDSSHAPPHILSYELLSHQQRRLLRDAHGEIRLYDVGWRRNIAQVFGWDRPSGWLARLLYGGGGKGDGRTWSRNPRADQLLARLAVGLADLEKER
ncbi:zf-DHHC-domain-containing protein [Obba rivulosa]|uniref:Palmitoyltransferase n=1 Tax=Obba rivulosa TaxID=1052685 RepID=A0A8E2DP19_9APHY|nr:zf-DHHC-domain-containing protein [Obba rivulosa]